MEENKNLNGEEKTVDTAPDSKLSNAEIKGTDTATVLESEKNVIRETTGDAVEIYDEENSVDLSDSSKKKKKKKFKKRYIVLGALLLPGFRQTRIPWLQ